MPDRVAIVSSSYPAGPGDPSGHFVAAEAEELARAGHDVLVVTTCGASPTRADVAFEDGVRVLRLWSGRAAGFPGIVARLRATPWQAAALGLWAVSAERALRERGPFRRIVAHWLLPCGFPIASRAARGAPSSPAPSPRGAATPSLRAVALFVVRGPGATRTRPLARTREPHGPGAQPRSPRNAGSRARAGTALHPSWRPLGRRGRPARAGQARGRGLARRATRPKPPRRRDRRRPRARRAAPPFPVCPLPRSFAAHRGADLDRRGGRARQRLAPRGRSHGDPRSPRARGGRGRASGGRHRALGRARRRLSTSTLAVVLAP